MFKHAIESYWLNLRQLKFIMAPIFAGSIPVLSLYSNNLSEVPFKLILVPSLIVVAITLLLYFASYLYSKDEYKSAISVSVFWIFFYSYVPIIELFSSKSPSIVNFDSILLPVWFLFLSTITWRIITAEWSLSPLFNAFLVSGCVLFTFQAAPIWLHQIKKNEINTSEYLHNIEQESLGKYSGQLPNIYYITPDSYPRTDVLSEYFNFENSDFDNNLRSLGFYVVSGSNSNYNHTILSLPSALNFSYIKNPQALDNTKLIEMYQDNFTARILRQVGYSIINNSSYFSTDFNRHADENVLCNKGNEFLLEMANRTPLYVLSVFSDYERSNKRSDTLCTIDGINGNDLSRNPRFVVTHLLPPHPPYLFDENGHDTSEVNISLTGRTRWFAKELYSNQLQYINDMLKDAVTEILSKDDNSIIIIQSDHGTLSSATEAASLKDTRPVVLKERSRNYIAIYLPRQCDKSMLYPTMTNVNTMRVVFNSCFGTEFEILEDKVFYAHPMVFRDNFRDITDIVR